MSRRLLLVMIALVAVAVAGFSGHGPAPAWAATCAEYPNQAAAQAAADTRDADGDGIYCESLPCPCSTTAPSPPAPAPAPIAPPVPAPAPSSTTTTPTTTPPLAPTASTNPAGCSTPTGVQNITFSKTKYPHIYRHFLDALKKGWPKTLVLNRHGASQRRARLLEGVATRPGYDRDEYPPALGRGTGKGLTRGRDPTGWRADVRLVSSSENRSHGSSMGIKLRRFCNGTKFRYLFY